MNPFEKNKQYVKFCLYGFLKNLRFYDAFLLIFLLDNGVSFSQVGILYAAREVMINIAEIPSGIIADIYGRKNSLIAAFLLYILSFIAFYYSNDFTILLIAMLLIGIGDAFRSGTHKGMIMDYLKLRNWEDHKIAYYGHTRSWSQKGSAVSALLAGLMVFFSGSYRIIYLVSIIPYVLNLINIYSYPDELNHSIKRKSRDRVALKELLKTVYQTLKKQQVLVIINSTALHSAFLKSIKDYIQPLMVNVAIILPVVVAIDSKSKSGLTIGICYFIIFLLTSYASQMAGKVSALRIKGIQKKTLLFGLLAGLLCGLLYHYEYWIVSLLVFVIIYIIENLRKPILTGFLVDNVPNEILTSVISTQSFYQTLTTAVLSISLGILADSFGIGIAFIFVSVSLVVLTGLLGRRKTNSAN